jgi:hypothetical protein
MEPCFLLFIAPKFPQYVLVERGEFFVMTLSIFRAGPKMVPGWRCGRRKYVNPQAW